MRHTRSISAVFATALLLFALSAEGAVMRAKWAGTIDDAVAGNPYALAVGDAFSAIGTVDEAALSALISDAEAAPVEVNVLFTVTALIAPAPATIPVRMRFTSATSWVALDDAGFTVASGSWSPDAMKFEPRVIPIPAALPLMLTGLGLLAGLRRRG